MNQVRFLFLLVVLALAGCTAAPSPAPAPPTALPVIATPTEPAISIADTPAPPGPTEDLSVNVPDPCSLLTGDEINIVLNKSVQQTTADSDPFKLKDVQGFANTEELIPLKFARRCSFGLNDPTGRTANPALILTLIPGRTSLDLERAQTAKPSLQDVQGIADSALWGADTFELEFIKGTNDLKLAVLDEGLGGTVDASHKLDQAKALAAKILARLP